MPLLLLLLLRLLHLAMLYLEDMLLLLIMVLDCNTTLTTSRSFLLLARLSLLPLFKFWYCTYYRYRYCCYDRISHWSNYCVSVLLLTAAAFEPDYDYVCERAYA